MQLCMDTWAPIDTPIALESGFDFARKFSIFSAALAGLLWKAVLILPASSASSRLRWLGWRLRQA